MKRIERHVIVNNKEIDNICFLSKNLYNISNFYIRRRYIKTGRFVSAYSLIKIFTRIDQFDYRALPAQSAQQILLLLEKNWKSFFKAIREFNKNPHKFKSRPKLPKFKHKIKGRNIVVFTKQQCNVRDNCVHFPKRVKLKPLRTRVDRIRQVRVIPHASCYIIEIVYEKEVKNVEVRENTYLSIDLGLNNLTTCTNNIGEKPFIVNGRPLKSMNQFFNKKRAKLMSFTGNKCVSKRLNRLTLKRNNKIEDYMHKVSRFIVNYCVRYRIQTIIIGHNKDWKQKIRIGKVNNQSFVLTPFNSLIDKIKYKAEEVGINVIINEESYTSKCSFLDLEPIKKQTSYLGKRVKRGLFKSSVGELINADVNGSYNILRKAFPEVFSNGIEGVGLHPMIINI